MNPSNPPGPPPSYRGYILAVAIMASFVTPFMGSALNVAIPAIGRELNIGATALHWVVTSYLLACAAFLVPFGRAADLWGRERIFVAGIALYAFTSLAVGFSRTGAVLIGFRALQGMSGAMIFGTGLAIVTSIFPRQERGRVLGLNIAAVYLGLSLGPVVGGILTSRLGWRWILYINAVMGVLTFIIAKWKLRGHSHIAPGGSFDWLGAVLYAGGMALAMIGASSLSSFAHAKGLLLFGAGLFVLFLIQQKRSAKPLIKLSLFRNPIFAYSNLAAMIHYSATFGVGFLLSLYLQVVKKMSAESAGLILLAQPAMMAALSPLAGRLSDRHEPRMLASSGMAITFLGIALFILIQPQTPPMYIIATLMLIGLGYSLFSSPNANAIMSSVDLADFGIASSILGAMRLTGQAMSMTLVGFFLGFYINKNHMSVAAEAAPANLLKSLHASFIAFALLSVIGIFCSLSRGKMKR